MKSTIKLSLKQIWEFSEVIGYFHKYLAIFYAIATRYGLFLQLILDYTGISNRSLGELGLK